MKSLQGRSMVKFLLPIVVFAAAYTISVLMVNSRAPLALVEPEKVIPTVQLTTVKKAAVPLGIRAHGTVTASRELNLAAEVNGRILWISPKFAAGVSVEKGDTLIRVEPQNYQAALAEAKASLANADLALADAQARKQRGAITEANARVEAARQFVAKAKRDLANTEIKAPFNAIVDSQLVEFAEYVTQGKVVARLLDSESAELRLAIATKDQPYLLAVQGEQVELSANGEKWIGRLLRIEQRIDSQTRVFPAVVEIGKPYDTTIHATALPLGLFAQVHFHKAVAKDAILLPRSALHEDNHVYVYAEGVLTARKVVVLREQNAGIIITDGLVDGDRVATTLIHPMFDGMRVSAEAE